MISSIPKDFLHCSNTLLLYRKILRGLLLSCSHEMDITILHQQIQCLIAEMGTYLLSTTAIIVEYLW